MGYEYVEEPVVGAKIKIYTVKIVQCMNMTKID